MVTTLITDEGLHVLSYLTLCFYVKNTPKELFVDTYHLVTPAHNISLLEENKLLV